MTEPAAFDLAAPDHGAQLATARPALSWSEAVDSGTGVAGYEIFADGVRVGETEGTTFTPPADLGEGDHSWRVEARDRAGNTRSSGESTFTVDVTAPSAPVPVAPAEGALLDPDSSARVGAGRGLPQRPGRRFGVAGR